MTAYSFVTVDVFTSRPFGGNQLAVLTDARGLDTAAMQTLTAEFNYAESTFLFPPKDPAHTAQLRIFTPKREMPFAGHPNVGVGYVVGNMKELFGKPIGETLLLEEGAGLVSIEVLRENGRVTGAMVTAPQPLKVAGHVDPAVIAACVSLDPSDVIVANHAPTVASVGAQFIFAELKDSATVKRAAANLPAIAAKLPVHGSDAVMIYARTGNEDIHARMFAPNHGIIEDAATGSAGAALTALLASLDPAQDRTLTLRISQGTEIGRPSLMLGQAVKRGGQIVAARIGGPSVPVTEGKVTYAP